MGDSIAKIRNQFNEYFQSLDNKQKMRIGLGSFFLVLTLAISIFLITRPKYTTLYSGLSLDESGKIIQKLDEMGIPYKDDNRGTSILVPEDKVNKARMNLAIDGFPQQGITWQSAFDSNSITMTNDDKKKKYLQADMNKMARTIEEINGIDKAIVLLAIPDSSNFLTEDIKRSKASVLLTLRSGFKLSEQQVNGIMMLVSNGVEGLEPSNISIVDNTGEILNDSSVAGDDYSLDRKIDIEDQITNRLKESLRNFLAKIYGVDNVDIMVNVNLDFDKEVTDITSFSPPLEGETSGLVRSYQELKEEVKNGAGGGPPGTDSNSEAITQYKEIDSNDSTYKKESKSVNYDLNEIRKSIVKESGDVKDITVAILLNKSTLEDEELTDEHRSKLIDLVSSAAGLETRKVEVMAYDFPEPKDLVPLSSEDNLGLAGDIPLLSIGIISLLFVIGAIFAIARIRRRRNEARELIDGGIDEIEDDIEEIEIDLNDKSSYKYQIEKFVDKKPESVAQLLRSWLNED